MPQTDLARCVSVTLPECNRVSVFVDAASFAHFNNFTLSRQAALWWNQNTTEHMPLAPWMGSEWETFKTRSGGVAKYVRLYGRSARACLSIGERPKIQTLQKRNGVTLAALLAFGIGESTRICQNVPAITCFNWILCWAWSKQRLYLLYAYSRVASMFIAFWDRWRNLAGGHRDWSTKRSFSDEAMPVWRSYSTSCYDGYAALSYAPTCTISGPFMKFLRELSYSWMPKIWCGKTVVYHLHWIRRQP